MSPALAFGLGIGVAVAAGLFLLVLIAVGALYWWAAQRFQKIADALEAIADGYQTLRLANNSAVDAVTKLAADVESLKADPLEER